MSVHVCTPYHPDDHLVGILILGEVLILNQVPDVGVVSYCPIARWKDKILSKPS